MSGRSNVMGPHRLYPGAKASGSRNRIDDGGLPEALDRQDRGDAGLGCVARPCVRCMPHVQAFVIEPVFTGTVQSAGRQRDGWISVVQDHEVFAQYGRIIGCIYGRVERGTDFGALTRGEALG